MKQFFFIFERKKRQGNEIQILIIHRSIDSHFYIILDYVYISVTTILYNICGLLRIIFSQHQASHTKYSGSKRLIFLNVIQNSAVFFFLTGNVNQLTLFFLHARHLGSPSYDIRIWQFFPPVFILSLMNEFQYVVNFSG